MADRGVDVAQFQDGVYLATRALDDGIDVRAGLILGRTRAIVIDTLVRPEDMRPVVEIIERAGLPCTVVNTHADWDHAWGNAAFPNATIVGHADCRRRLLAGEAREMLARKRREKPGFYEHVRIVPPAATFHRRMTIEAGGACVELHHLPGHTADSIVAFVPERAMLFAGDCVENPFPILESGPLDGWITGLRSWSTRGIQWVVPAHGPVGGRELLLANADYLESLASNPPLARGTARFYEDVHRQNVETARAARYDSRPN